MNKSWILTLALGSMVLMMFLVGENNPTGEKSRDSLIEQISIIQHGRVTRTERQKGVLLIEYEGTALSGLPGIETDKAVAGDPLAFGDECEIILVEHKDPKGKTIQTKIAVKASKKTSE